MRQKEQELWNRAYILLMIVNFFSWASYNMVAPVLTGYMESLGAGMTVCGFVGGLFAFTSCLSRPASGVMADSLNRKHLLWVFTMVMAVSLLIYSVIPSIPVILFFRGLHGVAFGISSTAGLVMVSECVPEKRMGEAIIYYGVMSVASMAIGPGVGIWVSEALGYRVCFLVSTVILFLAGVAALAIPYGYQREKLNEKRKLSFGNLIETRLIGLSGVNASFTMLNGIVSTFLVALAVERGISGVSWHFTLNAGMLIISRIFLAKVMNRWSLKQNLYPAFVCGILTLGLISRADTLQMLLIAAVVKSFAQGMSQPALQTESLRIVPPKKRGVACSTMYIGGDLGQAAGPILGGMVAERAGYGVMYMVFIAPLMMALGYFCMREYKIQVGDDNKINSLGERL